MKKYMFIKIRDNVTSITKLKNMFSDIDESDFNKLISLDPTYTNDTVTSGKYAEWILRLYKNNNLKSEDFYKVNEYLKTLNSNLQRLKALNVSTDINFYKTLPELSKALEKLDVKSNARKNRETRAAARQSNDIEHFMFTENFDIYIPLTYEASVKIGVGTEWCTATNSDRHYYDDYTKDGNKLYVMINKNDKSEKYQWNTKERYTANKHDNEINECILCVKHKDLIDFFNKVGYDIEDEVKKAIQIQSKPFVYEGNELIDEEKKYVSEIIVKEGIIELQSNLFENCKSLQSITIPNSVKKIGDWCFRDCISLQNVTIANGIAEIGKGCFAGCTSLQSITIPNSVKHIGDSCFEWCKSLTEINLSYRITELGKNFFANCVSLKYVYIPSDVTCLGKYCFEECTSLQKVDLSSSLTKLEDYCFIGCSSLQYVYISKNMKKIGNDCFAGCDNLTIESANSYVLHYCDVNGINFDIDEIYYNEY